MKIHKRKKNKRMKGHASHGYGFRKSHRKSGHKGGVGMAGSGKRADQKKSLILKIYGNNYFGKQGITSKKTAKNKENKINLREIQNNLNGFIKKGLAKKTEKGFEVDLSDYVLLGNGEIKEKVIIKVKKASRSAFEKINKAGGEIILHQK